MRDVEKAQRTPLVNVSQTLRDDRQSLVLLLVVAFPIVFLAIQMFSSSFTLDEGITYWITNEGISEAWSRSIDFQGQSPLYFLIVNLLRQVFGDTEFSLRFLSLIAVLISAIYILKLGTQLFSREVGLTAASIFTITLYPNNIDLLFARPYGLAVLLSTISTYQLVDFLKNTTRLSLIRYLTSGVLLFYCHYLFAYVVAFHALSVGAALILCPSRRLFKQSLVLVFLGGVLGLPALPQLLLVSEKSSFYSFALVPDFTTFLFELLWPDWITRVIAVFLLVKILLIRNATLSNIPRSKLSHLLFCLGWATVPVICVYFQSKFSYSVFLQRYFSGRCPGEALMLAILIVPQLRGKIAHFILLNSTILLLTIGYERGVIYGEDWKTGFQYVNSAALERGVKPIVLIDPGLVEQKNEAWQNSMPEVDKYLTSISLPYLADANVVPFSITSNVTLLRQPELISTANLSKLWIITRHPRDIQKMQQYLRYVSNLSKLEVAEDRFFSSIYIYRLH